MRVDPADARDRLTDRALCPSRAQTATALHETLSHASDGRGVIYVGDGRGDRNGVAHPESRFSVCESAAALWKMNV